MSSVKIARNSQRNVAIEYGEVEGARYQAYLNSLLVQCNQANNQAACNEWKIRMDKQNAHADRLIQMQKDYHSRQNWNN